jgi:hypothetical protein
LTAQYIRKQHEECVLFLDDCFDVPEVAEELTGAGYCMVERFRDHFPRTDSPGGKERGVKDPRVIALCNRRGWLMLTTDGNIRFTHVEEIKRSPNFALLATAHNKVDDAHEWVPALKTLRVKIQREFKKRQRPWVAQFSREGNITTIYTVTELHHTRRNHPKEKGTLLYVAPADPTPQAPVQQQ